MRLNNQKGVALAITLLVILVLLALSSIFILRTVNERHSVRRENQFKQALYMADGGAEAGLEQINTIINTYMSDTVNATNPQTISNAAQSAVSSGDGLGFLSSYALLAGSPQFTVTGAEATHMLATPVSVDGKTYSYNIVVTQKSNPSDTGLDSWDFPYFYEVRSTGSAGNVSSRVLLRGDFTVRVQHDNFARYALFTNNQTLPDGTNVWFTDKTNFAGPTHTNGTYNFALNPSGTFEGLVTQQADLARFYNNGSPVLLDADSNPGKDVPTFNAGFTRDADAITLSSSVQQQDMIDQAKGTETSTSNGIFVPNNGTALTGGIYVKGTANVTLTVNGSDNAVYTVTEGGTTKIITVSSDCSQTSVQTVGGGTSSYAGCPDGTDNVGTIIYVDGGIASLGGTVQRNTELTVASADDIVIQNNLVYSEYTPAVNSPGSASYVPPNADGATNLLGIVSWAGDVRVGTSSPNNVDIHGSILARDGVFQVDNYNSGSPRGTATLLGGVISDYYGAFGLFNGSTGSQVSGYGRNFVYDSRMSTGKAPPYFPTLNTFIVFTNDVTDKVAWQEGGF